MQEIRGGQGGSTTKKKKKGTTLFLGREKTSQESRRKQGDIWAACRRPDAQQLERVAKERGERGYRKRDNILSQGLMSSRETTASSWEDGD